MATVVRFISEIIDRTLSKVSHNLDFENTLPGRSFDQILENPEDKRKLDAAVEHLKQNRSLKSEDVILSDNETLTISIS